MSDTTTPKPGDTLTAAQANSLPVGSEIEWLTGPRKERMALSRDGKWRWLTPPVGEIVNHDGQLGAEFTYTLIRVGPAFAVGDVVGREQLDALPNRSRVKYDSWSDGFFLEKSAAGWSDQSGRFVSSLDGPYRLIRIGAETPANPHTPGTLSWARWAARYEGVCVRAVVGTIWRWCDHWEIWAWGGGWSRRDNLHRLSISECPVNWSIVPDPSAAETPVETSAETPVLHIDPAAIAEALDKAIPQWREEGFTVAQAIRVLRQRYEMQMQVCMYQGDSAAASAKYTKRLEEQVATLTAERDRLRTEMDKLCVVNDTQASKYKHVTEEFERVCTQRDAAIKEIGKSCATMATAHAEEINGIKAERDAAIARADAAEELLTLRHTAWQAAAKVVQSTHPEGSGAWAKDAMRMGYGVTNDNRPECPFVYFNGLIIDTEGDPRSIRDTETGWRIHTPAVAPSPLPSVAQLAESIEALNARIVALEAGQ